MAPPSYNGPLALCAALLCSAALASAYDRLISEPLASETYTKQSCAVPNAILDVVNYSFATTVTAGVSYCVNVYVPFTIVHAANTTGVYRSTLCVPLQAPGYGYAKEDLKVKPVATSANCITVSMRVTWDTQAVYFHTDGYTTSQALARDIATYVAGPPVSCAQPAFTTASADPALLALVQAIAPGSNQAVVTLAGPDAKDANGKLLSSYNIPTQVFAVSVCNPSQAPNTGPPSPARRRLSAGCKSCVPSTFATECVGEGFMCTGVSCGCSGCTSEQDVFGFMYGKIKIGIPVVSACSAVPCPK